MSWISDHYEKAAVAGTLLVAVALGYSGLQSMGSVEGDFSSVPEGKGPDDPSVKDGDKVATAKSSLQIKQQWTQDEINGRKVDLFTGVQLFVKKDNKEKPVDLPSSADVHPPIPNEWWLEYRIDPGFADSPSRDEDEDGFTNLEEFTAKTDPTDKRSHPNLIQKLAYLGDESVKWVLRPSGFPNEQEPAMNFEYSDANRVRVKTPAAEPIKPNGTFFADDAAKGAKERFKYLGFEKKVVRDERIEADTEIDIIKVQDLKPNKAGTIYEFPANFRTAEVGKFAKFDRTAKFSLEALGFNSQEFKVEEFTDFSLPQGAEKKNYRLMEVHSDRIVIRETLEDGTHQLHQITKRP